MGWRGTEHSSRRQFPNGSDGARDPEGGIERECVLQVVVKIGYAADPWPLMSRAIGARVDPCHREERIYPSAIYVSAERRSYGWSQFWAANAKPKVIRCACNAYTVYATDKPAHEPFMSAN